MTIFKVTAMRLVDEPQTNGNIRLADFSVEFDGVVINHCSVYKRPDSHKPMFGGPPPSIMGKGHCVSIDDRKLRYAIALEAARMYRQLGGKARIAPEMPNPGPMPEGMQPLTHLPDLEERIAKAKPFNPDHSKSIADEIEEDGATLGWILGKAIAGQKDRQD